jgi:hypothetical protein
MKIAKKRAVSLKVEKSKKKMREMGKRKAKE